MNVQNIEVDAYRVWRVTYDVFKPRNDNLECPTGYHWSESHTMCIPDIPFWFSATYRLKEALTETQLRTMFQIPENAKITYILDNRMKNGGRETR